MANEFTSIQENQASQKFLLARMKPARYMNDALSNTSGTEYQGALPFVPVAVEQNGVELTKVTGTPVAGEWSYSGTTLTVNTVTAPSSTSAIVAFYYIFLTGEKFRVLGKDPETPLVDLSDWEPKISRSPQLGFEVRNVLNGTLTISSSSITMINDNDDFNKYLTDNDSFYQKEINIWQCLDSTDNIFKLFQGQVSKLTINRTAVSISFEDDNSRLKVPALMGDDSSTAYFSKSGFPNVEPAKEGRTIPYFFGRVSRYQLENDGVTGLLDAQKINPDSLYEAVCTDYSAQISTSLNREFGIARFASGGIEAFGFTPSAVDNTNGAFTILDGTAAEIDKFFVGDTFVDSNTAYSRVIKVDRVTNKIYITKNAGFILTDSVLSNDCPSIVITDFSNNRFYPLVGRDYTTSVSTLSSGNKYLKITFANNFEATLAMPTLDPNNYIVKYRVHPNNANQKHGTVINEILEKSGITVNAASITTANSTFDVNANFSIPFFDELDFSNYYKYVEEILQSTLGFVHLNNDFEMEYVLFNTPVSGMNTQDVDIIEDTYRVSIEYSDIFTQIISFNPHYSSEEVNSESSATAVSVKAQYLHNINRATRFRHVLEDMTTKITDHINIKSNRLATYNFKTKQINYTSEIGDNINLVKNGIPGQAASRNVKIIGIKRKVNETTIKASDLLDL